MAYQGVFEVTIKPRPYQDRAHEAMLSAYARGVQRPAVVAATGSGKTIMLARLARERLAKVGGRVLVLAHRIELVENNAQKVIDVDPLLNVGIVKGSRNETRADVISASVDTLRGERRRQMLTDVSTVIVDECHRASAPTYMQVLKHFGCYDDGGAVAAGYTATMTRGDGKALGDVWQEIVETVDIASLVREGFLCRPRGLRVKVEDLDLTKVKKSGGEFQPDALGAALEHSLAPEKIAEAITEHAASRRGVLFAPTVHSAGVIADALIEAGITARVMHAGSSDEERRQVKIDSEAGRVQIVCNALLYTEGTDWPWIDLVVIARSARGKGTFVQMAGRGLRLYPGKRDCLIMMIGGAAAGHSLMAPVELFGESAEDLDRDPCTCALGLGLGDCQCGRRRCTEFCPCGGGGQDCGCPRPEVDDLLDDDELGTDLDDLGATGSLVAVEVDLFEASENAWDRTLGHDVWFLPAGRERLIAIIPGDPAGRGGWDVVAMNAKPWDSAPWSRWVVRGVSELPYAMAHAEGEVTPAERKVARKDASWRSGKPYVQQRRMLTENGFVVPAGATNGEVDSMVVRMFASQRIDPKVPAYARHQLINA